MQYTRMLGKLPWERVQRVPQRRGGYIPLYEGPPRAERRPFPRVRTRVRSSAEHARAGWLSKLECTGKAGWREVLTTIPNVLASLCACVVAVRVGVRVTASVG